MFMSCSLFQSLISTVSHRCGFNMDSDCVGQTLWVASLMLKSPTPPFQIWKLRGMNEDSNTTLLSPYQNWRSRRSKHTHEAKKQSHPVKIEWRSKHFGQSYDLWIDPMLKLPRNIYWSWTLGRKKQQRKKQGIRNMCLGPLQPPLRFNKTSHKNSFSNWEFRWIDSTSDWGKEANKLI